MCVPVAFTYPKANFFKKMQTCSGVLGGIELVLRLHYPMSTIYCWIAPIQSVLNWKPEKMECFLELILEKQIILAHPYRFWTGLGFDLFFLSYSQYLCRRFDLPVTWTEQEVLWQKKSSSNLFLQAFQLRSSHNLNIQIMREKYFSLHFSSRHPKMGFHKS